MRGLHGLSALGLTAALATSAAAQAPDPRSELEVMAHALELAVSKVSRPVGWTFVPDGDSALSYHVAGFGAIFVVAPRAISGRTVSLGAEGGSVIPRVMRVVEQTLQQAESPETKQRLQKILEGLRRQQEELAVRAAAQERQSATLQRLTEERLARRAREAAQGLAVDSRQRVKDAAAAEEALQRLEAEAAAFQRQAEAAQQAAERALGDVAREMRARLGGAEPGAPGPPAETLAGPAEAPLGPAPPWRFWNGLEPPREERPATTVVGAVREAVTRVLESHAGGLHILRPQDVVLVTVDFVPQGALRLRARPEKTLVVRVRKKELEDRAAGSLDPKGLRSRIEYIEY